MQAKDKFIQRLRRREQEEAAARKKLSQECFDKCKKEWKASVQWIEDYLTNPVPGSAKYLKVGDF